MTINKYTFFYSIKNSIFTASVQWVNENISKIDFQIGRGLEGVTDKHFDWEQITRTPMTSECLQVSIDTSDKFWIGGKKRPQTQQTFTHQSDDHFQSWTVFPLCSPPEEEDNISIQFFPFSALALRVGWGGWHLRSSRYIFYFEPYLSINNAFLKTMPFQKQCAFPKTMRLSKSAVLKP